MKAEIVKEFTFEAAHHLPEVGPDHKCSRVHGHLFKVEVAVEGEVDVSKCLGLHSLDRVDDEEGSLTGR